MTKADIMAIITEANKNKDIKWDVSENTENKIVLTNSYDKCVKISIKICENGIVVKDDHMQQSVEYLLKGETRWDDYKDDNVGVMYAIRSAVNYFYYTY